MEDQLKKWLKALKLNESTISMLLGGLVVVVVGILIYNYFTSVNKGVPEISEEAASEEVELVEEGGKLVPKNLPLTHKVTKGEHLWTIAEKYYGSGYNWVDISRENKLRSPSYITEGQELTIPKTAVIAPVGDKKEAALAVIEGSSYTVVKGDNLWQIAVRAYQDGYKWPEVARANADKIANPNLIEVGMVLKLPR